MSDEITLVRALVDEPPERDDLAMLRARQRLRDAIDRETEEAPKPSHGTRAGGVRGPIRWVAALVALIAVAFGLQLVLPAGHGGPSGSAADELNHLAGVAAAQPAMNVGPGEAVYTETDETARHTFNIVGSTGYSLVVNKTVRTWLSADGSGHRSTTIHSVDFASAADQAAWRDDGSPQLPAVGTTDEEYQAGGLKYFDLDQLPTDPAPLLAAIESGKADEAPPEGDAALFDLVGTLLGQGNATPALRQGLFEVAAGIEGVTVDQDATDRLGRNGVGVSLIHDGFTSELIVDPSTSALLEQRITDPDGTLEESLAYATPKVVPANSR